MFVCLLLRLGGSLLGWLVGWLVGCGLLGECSLMWSGGLIGCVVWGVLKGFHSGVGLL